MNEQTINELRALGFNGDLLKIVTVLELRAYLYDNSVMNASYIGFHIPSCFDRKTEEDINKTVTDCLTILYDSKFRPHLHLWPIQEPVLTADHLVQFTLSKALSKEELTTNALHLVGQAMTELHSAMDHTDESMKRRLEMMHMTYDRLKMMEILINEGSVSYVYEENSCDVFD